MLYNYMKAKLLTWSLCLGAWSARTADIAKPNRADAVDAWIFLLIIISTKHSKFDLNVWLR